MKLWAGRFSKEADERVNDFNSSIRFDCRMFAQDITGSMAHAQMLALLQRMTPGKSGKVLLGFWKI